MTILAISTFFIVELGVLFVTSQDFLGGLSELRSIIKADEAIRKAKQLSPSLHDSLEQIRLTPDRSDANTLYFVAESKALEQLKLCLSFVGRNSDVYPLIEEAIKHLAQLKKSSLEIFLSNDKSIAKQLVVEQLVLEWNEILTKSQISLTEKSSVVFDRLYAIRLRPLISSVTLAIVFLIMALILGLRISAKLQHSTGSLVNAINIISGGNLDYRAPLLEHDEIGRLTHAFNAMTSNLQETTVSKHHIENIINSMLDCLLVFSEDGTILRINPATTDILGYDSHELLNRSIQSLFSEDLTSISQSKNIETTCLKKDGTKTPVILSVSPLQNLGEGLKTRVCIIKDISDIRAAEEDLREKNILLANANRELESFSYSVSHDLRAPLRAVDGFSQALVEDYSNTLDDEAKRYLSRIRIAIQKMGALIDDILKLSRINRTEMNLEQVNLGELAHLVYHDIKEQQAKDRTIDFIVTGDLTCYADYALARIVLENLIGNSVKYTSKHPTARIELGATTIDGKKTFYIKDDGAGFDMAYAQKLFGAFQRLHRDSEFSGSGVGLATVQRIIHRHQGKIWVDAAVERGATFYFTFGISKNDFTI
ncbi:MAG: hypothetical protein A2622_07215 [Bdellovibrionales bacterium RIFCSPHIGHO2_01_FULL_40_29]|nr:MAG: hypothetical protein A2622_07215 [Bdellovibrionales bacterium RIFCSPHIGHO2_01_FULL_40_29]OFZ33264.1 MAG: hypothetical protein A3D17_12235 [Bdellovibrionales bacterium RIFCSPHIGHO2_02_FULL_40_15]